MEPVGAAYVSLLVACQVAGVSMFIIALRRRAVPGGLPLAAYISTLVMWTGAYLLEILSHDFSLKLFWFNIRQIGVVVLPVATFVLAWEVYRQERWTHAGRLVLLSVVPAITVILTFANHPVVRDAVKVQPAFGIDVVVAERGFWYAVSSGYSYVLVTMALVMLVDVLLRALPGQRGQPVGLLLGIMTISLGQLTDILGVNPLRPLGPTAVMMLPASACIMWGVYRHRLLDTLPIAYDRVFKAISDGVLVIDRTGRIVDLNRAARTILTRAIPGDHKWIGTPFNEALASWSEWTENYRESRPKFEITRGSGDSVETFDVNITHVTGNRDQALAQIMVIKDVTKQKEAFALLAERERILVLQRFIKDASHDLRTPVSVVQSSAYLMRRLIQKQSNLLDTLAPKLPQVYAEVVESAKEVGGKLVERAEAADEASKRLWAILSGMLEMAELEDVSILEKQVLDLNTVVGRLVNARKLEADRRSLTLTFEPAARLPMIQADDRRLTKAVEALLINALIYNQPEGAINVKTAHENSTVYVEVRDTGVGISPDDLPQVFDRFFRTDHARRTNSGAAGLGLSLAKAIIDAHGGRIEAQSVEGEGSTFRVLLPAG